MHRLKAAGDMIRAMQGHGGFPGAPDPKTVQSRSRVQETLAKRELRGPVSREIRDGVEVWRT